MVGTNNNNQEEGEGYVEKQQKAAAQTNNYTMRLTSSLATGFILVGSKDSQDIYCSNSQLTENKNRQTGKQTNLQTIVVRYCNNCVFPTIVPCKGSLFAKINK